MASSGAGVKRTRRIRDESDDFTIEKHIAVRRQEFVKRRKEVPELLQRARALRSDAALMTRRFEWRQQQDKLAQAAALEREAEIRQSMAREHDYEARVVTYLQTHHAVAAHRPYVGTAREPGANGRRITADTDAQTSQQEAQRAILDEFLVETHRAPPKVAMSARDVCPRCVIGGEVALILNQVKSTMTCPKCGYAMAYLDATSSSTSFDEIVEFSQYSYKRVNHYMLHLALLQGKEAHVVSDEVINEVMMDLLKNQGLKKCEEVTCAHVRTALRRNRLRKAYDHVTQITARISGKAPPRISAQTETQLKNMFLQMQPSFQRHAPRSRTNFLSYSYVLYRCFQILGLHHMLDSLALLKGRDKLEANDEIFKKISAELGWPIFDLPPDS